MRLFRNFSIVLSAGTIFFGIVVAFLQAFIYFGGADLTLPIEIEKLDPSKYYFGLVSLFNMFNYFSQASSWMHQYGVERALQSMVDLWENLPPLVESGFESLAYSADALFEFNNIPDAFIALFNTFLFFAGFVTGSVGYTLLFIIVTITTYIGYLLANLGLIIVMFFTALFGGFNIPLPNLNHYNIPNWQDAWQNIFNIIVSLTPLYR